VDPAFYQRARSIEDRLIRLIDAGENLADWYPVTRLPVVARRDPARAAQLPMAA